MRSLGSSRCILCAVLLASPLYTTPRASSTLRGSDAHLPAGNSDLLSWFRLLAWFLNWDFAVHLRKTPKNWVVKSTLIGHHPVPARGTDTPCPSLQFDLHPDSLFSARARSHRSYRSSPGSASPQLSGTTPPLDATCLPSSFTIAFPPIRLIACF
jgi:hypothetical protein